MRITEFNCNVMRHNHVFEGRIFTQQRPVLPSPRSPPFAAQLQLARGKTSLDSKKDHSENVRMWK
ncbi:hypothetical protein LIA77_09117 [Sarocladium implicatum]|nr:hypothetical protein LIA77_09117 [Sarocladium implicatum]